jgi:cysteine desulfurase
MKRIYLDHAAGSPLRPEAREAMEAALEDLAGNPSSLHEEGRAARRIVEEAREAVAELAGCAADELVFTSGGTEANRLGLEGAALAARERAELAASEADHPSVLGCLEDLSARGFRTRLFPVDSEGLLSAVSCQPLDRARGHEPVEWPSAAVMSLLWVNNETGAIQDAEGIIAGAKAAGWTVHVDACQAPGRLDMAALHDADLVSLSAAKIGGPGGIGALVVRPGSGWTAPWTGGKQEGRRRPGTEAAVLAAGFGGASAAAVSLQLGAHSSAERSFLGALRELGLAFRINGPEAEGRRAGILNLSFRGWEADQLCAALDLAGVAASPGAACSSGVVRASHVLRAMERSEAEARTGVRFSFGWSSTGEEAREAAARLARVLGARVAKNSPSPYPSPAGRGNGFRR